ncbi:hsp70 nucleotide exchange factor fes1 [Geranomyces michiganensis]|nr:hsp70 nucleotide exchange factor fes1 [Geranomyces michiganensis]
MSISQSELLQWGTAHSTPGDVRPTIEPIDPKWLDVILGKEDAIRMKDCMEVIQSTGKSLADKETAFDELEMLVESLDNANDLRPLKLWEPLIEIVSNNEEPTLRKFAAWVMGTAVQNNGRAQQDFLAVGGLDPVLKALADDADSDVRGKALHCAIRQNPSAIEAFMEKNGVAVLAAVASDGDARLLKRAVFLIRSLIEEESPAVAAKVAEAACANSVPEMAADLMMSEKDDVDLTEKLLTAIASTYPQGLSAEFKARIKDELIPSVKHAMSDDEPVVSSELLQRLEAALLL